MNNTCPCCGSEDTRQLVRIDEDTVERICEICGLTYNVPTNQAVEVIHDNSN